MQIHAKAVDEAGRITFEGQCEVDPVSLMVLGESRENFARSKGRAFNEGAVPFFGAQLIQAAQEGCGADKLHMAAIDVALAAWLGLDLQRRERSGLDACLARLRTQIPCHGCQLRSCASN